MITLLALKPLIEGLDIPGPVDIRLIPGNFDTDLLKQTLQHYL